LLKTLKNFHFLNFLL